MKYLLLLLLAGCATGPSDYNRGCRDGINRYNKDRGAATTQTQPSYIDFLCASLDYENEGKKLQRERPGR